MIIQNQIFYRQRKGLVPKGDLGVPNNTPKNSYGLRNYDRLPVGDFLRIDLPSMAESTPRCQSRSKGIKYQNRDLCCHVDVRNNGRSNNGYGRITTSRQQRSPGSCWRFLFV